MVKEETHLQENTYFDLSRSHEMLLSSLYTPMIYAPAKFKVATSNGLGGGHLQET